MWIVQPGAGGTEPTQSQAQPVVTLSELLPAWQSNYYRSTAEMPSMAAAGTPLIVEEEYAAFLAQTRWDARLLGAHPQSRPPGAAMFSDWDATPPKVISSGLLLRSRRSKAAESGETPCSPEWCGQLQEVLPPRYPSPSGQKRVLIGNQGYASNVGTLKGRIDSKFDRTRSGSQHEAPVRGEHSSHQFALSESLTCRQRSRP